MDNLVDTAMLKLTVIGLGFLAWFSITKGDIAWVLGVASSAASTCYWVLKLYRDFVRKKKSKDETVVSKRQQD